MTILEQTRRTIRSYVLRQGRMTTRQQQAMKIYWSEFGLDVDGEGLLHWPMLFGRDAPVVMEIGFGMGDSLVAMTKAQPEYNFVGIEVHQPGVGRCLANAKAYGLDNLKVIAHDAIAVLNQHVPDASLDKVLLLFPDPWPKVKHHKRRIVNAEFAALIAKKLKLCGQFHLATDWQPYADHMLTVLEACESLTNAFGAGNFAPDSQTRLPTKFERRGQNLGHAIFDLIFTRSPSVSYT